MSMLQKSLQKIKDHTPKKKKTKQKKTGDNSISQLIYQSVRYLESHGLEQEGIFRVSGKHDRIQELYQLFLKNKPIDLEHCEDVDVHTVAGLLKRYLRELEDPLLTYKLYPDWILVGKSFKAHEDDQQPPDNTLISALSLLIEQLPPNNQTTLSSILKLLWEITQHSQINKMTASNLAKMFAPNILRSKSPEEEVQDLVPSSTVVMNLITCYPSIFPQDVSSRSSFDSSTSSTGSFESEADEDTIDLCERLEKENKSLHQEIEVLHELVDKQNEEWGEKIDELVQHYEEDIERQKTALLEECRIMLEEKQQLKNTVKQLERAKKKKEDEITALVSSLTSEKQQLEQQTILLQEQLNQVNQFQFNQQEEQKQFYMQLEQLREEAEMERINLMNQFSSQLKTLSAEKKALTIQVEKLQQDNESLLSQRKTTPQSSEQQPSQQSATSLKEVLRQKEDAIVKLHKELQEKKTEIQKLNDRNEQKTAMVNQLKTQVETLHSSLKEQESHHQKDRATIIDNTKDEEKRLLMRIKLLEGEKLQLQKQVQHYNSTNQQKDLKAEGKIEQLEDTVERLNNQIAELSVRLKQKEKEAVAFERLAKKNSVSVPSQKSMSVSLFNPLILLSLGLLAAFIFFVTNRRSTSVGNQILQHSWQL